VGRSKTIALGWAAASLLGCSANPTPGLRPIDPPRASALPADPDPPSPSAVASAAAVPDGPGPVLNEDLHRFRRAAEERVLGRQCPPGARAFAYAAPDAVLPPPPPPAPPPAASAAVAQGQGDAHGRLGTTADSTPEGMARPDKAKKAKEKPPRPPPPIARFVPIENEGALTHFHQALARLARGRDPDKKVRILAYGASHTQADVYTGYLRAYLQARFGDGGQGFVLFGKVNKWYRTLDSKAQSHALSLHATRYKDGKQDEPLGLFGAALVGHGADGWAEVATSARSTSTRFEAHYFEEPGGGDFDLLVDGKVVAHVKTHSATARPGYRAFEAPAGKHEIRAKLRGNGPVRLFGVTAETEGAGVVVDTLGIGGARMDSHLHWREDAWIDAVRHRNPDLVTFAYGTNEATSTSLSTGSYEARLKAVIARLRKAAPEVSCVLLSPFDFPRSRDGKWVTRKSLVDLVAAQRRVAMETGCGFWNGFAFMGGKGSMARWASIEPRLAADDHTHLTKLGYVYAGIAIADALMRKYDWDEAHAPPPAAEARSQDQR
jgi:lysophospholipase L1-like esterase